MVSPVLEIRSQPIGNIELLVVPEVYNIASEAKRVHQEVFDQMMVYFLVYLNVLIKGIIPICHIWYFVNLYIRVIIFWLYNHYNINICKLKIIR
jgi:hypothetical protein